MAPKTAAKGKAKSAKTTKENEHENDIEEFWDDELGVNVSWDNFANVYSKVRALHPIEKHIDVVEALTEALGPCPAELLPAVNAAKERALAPKETQKDPDEEEEENEEEPVSLRPEECDEDDNDKEDGDDQEEEASEQEEDEGEDEDFPETLKEDPEPKKALALKAPEVKTKAPEHTTPKLTRTLTDATTMVLGEAGQMCTF